MVKIRAIQHPRLACSYVLPTDLFAHHSDLVDLTQQYVFI